MRLVLGVLFFHFEEDLIYYLETGFTPDYDTASGSMVKVIENLSQLRSGELVEIAKYLKSLTDG